MRFSLLALIRLVAMLVLTAGTVAVAVARLVPPPEWGNRSIAAPRYDVLNRVAFAPRDSRPRSLDLTTGKVGVLALPREDELDYASCSPWTDELGNFEIVGRWKSRASGKPAGTTSFESFGLAHYRVPSGEVLDRVTLDMLPSSPPCWYPGTTARVLFAAGDGALYSFDFDDAARGEGESERPRPLTWRCRPPGEVMIVSDPTWPRDPRLGGRLIVSLQFCTRQADEPMTPARLWWLELGGDGLSIVDAGPLIDPAPRVRAFGTDLERCPKLSTLPDGSLALAYLWQPGSLEHWDLRLAPVTFDDRTHAPVVRSESARTLRTGHVPTAASFSPDGRWVFGYLLDAAGRRSIVRVPTGA